VNAWRALYATTIACLVAATAAIAQTSDDSLSEARLLLNSATAHFSRQAYGSGTPTSTRDDTAYFQKMRQASEVLTRKAPVVVAADALDGVQSVFAERLLARPATLAAAIDECEKRHDPQLTALVSGTLSDYLGHSLAGQTAGNPRLFGAVAPPRTIIDLVWNIKFAVDHDAVLRDEFYTEENLHRFFGSAGTMVHRVPDGEYTASGESGPCHYEAGKRRNESGAQSGGLRLRCVGGATYDEVVKLFGAPSSGDRQKAHYELSTGAAKRVVDMSFDTEGALQFFELDEQAPAVK
jgi:hypothetical protein